MSMSDYRNHIIAQNGPQNMPPDWLEQDDDTISIKEALQNIVESAIPIKSYNRYYIIEEIDFNAAVKALKRGI